MTIEVQRLGLQDYAATWQAMREFTETRSDSAPDQIWLLEHPAVYTLGLAGRREHIIDAGAIPTIHSDRGGQVTYHGPGQLVAYLLLDLKRRGWGIKALVYRTEQAAIEALASLGIAGARKSGAPGVYVDDAKVAALGFRIRKGCCYHGVSINVDMDLEPYSRINPCGYQGLRVTSLRELGVGLTASEFGERFLAKLSDQLIADVVVQPMAISVSR